MEEPQFASELEVGLPGQLLGPRPSLRLAVDRGCYLFLLFFILESPTPPTTPHRSVPGELELNGLKRLQRYTFSIEERNPTRCVCASVCV